MLYTRGLHLGLQGFWLDLRILDFGYIVLILRGSQFEIPGTCVELSAGTSLKLSVLQGMRGLLETRNSFFRCSCIPLDPEP